MIRSVAADDPSDWRPKTHVSFRITLPPSTFASVVDVLGSWDNFATPIPLEQDRRVGHDVWKGIMSQNGGLEMGSEHYYYFLLDRKHRIPDPQSSPSTLTVDPRSGKLISILFVPVELPPSSQLNPGISAAAALANFDRQVSAAVRAPLVDKRLPPPPSPQAPSFRNRLHVRRRVARLLGSEPEPLKRRRTWGLQLSVSTTFLKRSCSSVPSPCEDNQILPRDEAAIRDIAGYLRSNNPTPVSGFPVPSEPSPDMYSSFYSSEDDDGDEEAVTPADEEPAHGTRYWNFDELRCGDGNGLGDLREQVAGEVRWRQEMGYLGSFVV